LLVPFWFRWIIRERGISGEHRVDDPAAEVFGQPPIGYRTLA
jgi:hypothetical protein